MSPPASAVLRPPRRKKGDRHRLPERPEGCCAQTAPVPLFSPHFVYGRQFWLAYTSNALLLMAVALLFRYADFITLLGGTEFHLGWIVGIGTLGSLFTRLLIGSWLDRYGTRLLWIGSALLFAATCFAHLAVRSHTGVAIYLLRISYCFAVAGANGASMTFISKCGPRERLAELVGMLGTAGFLAYIVGTPLGDLLLGSLSVGRTQVVEMFVLAGLLAICSLPFAWAATRAEAREHGQMQGTSRSRKNNAANWVARPERAWRASTLNSRDSPRPFRACHPTQDSTTKSLAAEPAATPPSRRGVGGRGGDGHRPGAAHHLPADLRHGLGHPADRPVLYGLRRRGHHYPRPHPPLAERFGPRPIILLGMAGMAASLLLFLPVRAEWHLVLPAIGFGCSHAVLFPSVVAAGSATFPLANRGLATLLVLATWDAGQLIGAPPPGPCSATAPWPACPPIRPCSW